MRDVLIAALVVTLTTGAASAPVANFSASGTNSLWSISATSDVLTLLGASTPSVQAGPSFNQSAAADPGLRIGEPISLSMNAGQPDQMQVERTNDWSFVDSVDIQFQRDALFRRLDELLLAEVRGSSFHFGVDKEIKFVEHHYYQPGIPAPVGMAYRKRPKGLTLFAELAPILDPTPTDSLGWGGGIGIRFYFGR